MGNLFSNVFWQMVQPGNLWVLALVLGALLLFTPWRRLGRTLVLLAAILGLVVFIFPVGAWLLWPLETRFPPLTELPDKVDGVIMLGGDGSPGVIASRHRLVLKDHAIRLIAFADAARRYPQAKLIVTGSGPESGNGSLGEANATREVLQALGMDISRVLFDSESHDAPEQVSNAKALAHPAPGETWLLVASAVQTPRAVGLFRTQGWPVIADPVDYQSVAAKIQPIVDPDFEANLRTASLALNEWAGLLYDRVMGYSSSLFPSP